MIVGIPREVKDNEYRVAVTPAGVRELSVAGHRVLVEGGAGTGSAIPDEAYVKYGAELAGSALVVSFPVTRRPPRNPSTMTSASAEKARRLTQPSETASAAVPALDRRG